MRMWACIYGAVDCLLLSLILVSFLVCFVFNIHDYVSWAFSARFHQDTLHYGFFGGKNTVSFSQFWDSLLAQHEIFGFYFLADVTNILLFTGYYRFFSLFLSMRSLVFEYKMLSHLFSDSFQRNGLDVSHALNRFCSNGMATWQWRWVILVNKIAYSQYFHRSEAVERLSVAIWTKLKT